MLRPAERLRRAVLTQPTVEHGLHGDRFLVRVERGTDQILGCALARLRLPVGADLGADLAVAELLERGIPFVAGDQHVAPVLDVGADADRGELAE